MKPLSGRLPAASIRLAAFGLAMTVLASPAMAQRTYGPSDGYGRAPERYPEPRRPRPQGYPGGGFPGIGIIVAPPVTYDAPPPRVIYEDDEPPPSRPAGKPAKPKQKPVAKKPPAAKPTALKPPPSSPPPAKPAAAARRAAPPPPARTPAASDHVPDEVVFELKPDISEAELAGVLRRFALTPLARHDLALLGTSIQHARIPRGSQVPTVVRQLAADPRVASAQPNFVFDGQAETAPEAAPEAPAAASPELAAAQYAPARMKIPEAHRLADGKDVLVAVIDSAVDPTHPELKDALIEPDAKAKPHTHGTGMAGAIAAHIKLVGIAPQARLLAIDALKYDTAGSAKGTSIDIVTALDAAAKRGARVVNLSFAGPRDELMARALRALRLRGAVLIAAAGNEGPKAKPLYPAAHPDVIAVTATGPDDALYAQANVGGQIAIAAPGVEVMVPAPGDAYQVLSGTSLASAHVSGVVALMLQRHPELTPAEVREVLVRTARDLGKSGRDDLYGAGLIDAAAAVAEAGESASTATAAPMPSVPEAATMR